MTELHLEGLYKIGEYVEEHLPVGARDDERGRRFGSGETDDAFSGHRPSIGCQPAQYLDVPSAFAAERLNRLKAAKRRAREDPRGFLLRQVASQYLRLPRAAGDEGTVFVLTGPRLLWLGVTVSHHGYAHIVPPCS